MSNNSSRGGMKDDHGKHQGVRKGSSATKKDRAQTEKRHAVVPKSKNK
jgi:hypothetical protein